MLKVNRMSNATDGKGITSMAMIAKITMGIAIPFASVKLSDCRKSDTNAPFILSLIYQYVVNKLKNNLRIKFFGSNKSNLRARIIKLKVVGW